jgi:hypothetical protein
LRMISRGCAAAGGSHWTSQSEDIARVRAARARRRTRSSRSTR